MWKRQPPGHLTPLRSETVNIQQREYCKAKHAIKSITTIYFQRWGNTNSSVESIARHWNFGYASRLQLCWFGRWNHCNDPYSSCLYALCLCSGLYIFILFYEQITHNQYRHMGQSGTADSNCFCLSFFLFFKRFC